MASNSDEEASIKAGPFGASGNWLSTVLTNPSKRLRIGLGDVALERIRAGDRLQDLPPELQFTIVDALEPILKRSERVKETLLRASECMDDIRSQLASTPVAQLPPGETSEDWFNRFRRYAEDVSGENIRDVFARVLAGEAVYPGAFSLQTLEALRMMDLRVAKALEAVRPYLVNGAWLPCWGGLEKLLLQVDIDELISAGLATAATSLPPYTLETDDDSYRGIYRTEGRVIEIRAHKRPKITYVGVLLTRAGRELAMLIPASHDEDHFQTLLAALDELNANTLFVGTQFSIAWTDNSSWADDSPSFVHYDSKGNK